MRTKAIFLILIAALALTGTAAVTAADTVPLDPAHVGATNPGFTVGTCPPPPAGQEG